MYFLAVFFWVASLLTIRKLRANRDKGPYAIPDFQFGYNRQDLMKFREVPGEVVVEHYSLDAVYILLYLAASLTTSLSLGAELSSIWWIPAMLGSVTGILDCIENSLLLGYYMGIHEMPMITEASRLTQAKGIFAYGWFITVPLYLLWALWKLVS